MKRKCLYCYQPVYPDLDFHERCSLEFFGTPTPPILEYSLGQMDELARQVVMRSVAVPGVQPKLSMSMLTQARDKSDARLTVVGALGGAFILKPPSERFPEMPENEHVSMRMAASFGIPVVPSSLIRLASGELCYIAKRVDRTEAGEKIHMIDMFQIMEAFDKYKSSMEKVGKAIASYSENRLLDLTYYFDMVLFSWLTGNNDMHLKNFSMIESPSGWVLAPAYDLINVAIVLPDDKEELALPVAGKKSKLSISHFEQFGTGLGLHAKQTRAAFHRMKKYKEEAFGWIERSFLSADRKAAYGALVTTRYKQLAIPE